MFLNENIYISIMISLKFDPMAQLTIFQRWFRKWLFAVTCHYLNQWCLVYGCIYASIGINELTDLMSFGNPILQLYTPCNRHASFRCNFACCFKKATLHEKIYIKALTRYFHTLFYTFHSNDSHSVLCTETSVKASFMPQRLHIC